MWMRCGGDYMKKSRVTRVGQWADGSSAQRGSRQPVRLLGTGAALAAAAMVICAPSASAASMTLVNGLVQGTCLDAQTMDGVTLTGVAQVITCNSGPAQQWINGSANSLRNGLNPGMCLDAQTMDGTSLTGVAQVIPCNGGLVQEWFTGPGNTLHNGLDGAMCLDGQTLEGRTLTSVVQVIPCNGGPAQQW
ncbi:hypothetical protein GCM10027262_52970 [Nocardia tengchongensis]